MDLLAEMRLIKNNYVDKDKKGKGKPKSDWTVTVEKKDVHKAQISRDNLIDLFREPHNDSKCNISYSLVKKGDGENIAVVINLLDMPAHYVAVLELLFSVAADNGTVIFLFF